MTEKEYYWWKSRIKKYYESRIGINCIAVLFLFYYIFIGEYYR